jgi:hypothetical protein
MSVDGQPPNRAEASAVVVGGNRIPFARTGGAYTKSSNQDMLTAALDGLIARFGLQDERIGEVAAGAVLKHSRDFNLTREAVLGSALSPETPAYDLQQACATGLETVLGLANKIRLGQLDSGHRRRRGLRLRCPDCRQRRPPRGAPGPQPRQDTPAAASDPQPPAAQGPRPVDARTPESPAQDCPWVSTRP